MRKSTVYKCTQRQTERPLVSVIIPVYNAERYLKQMLETVEKQTLENIEIICINDGSADDSTRILEQLKKDDNRVKYIEKPHSNAGETRNTGLRAATGEYIAFWDADDLFDKHTLEIMYKKAKHKKADICVCGVNEFTCEGKVYEADGYLRKDLLPKKSTFNKYDISGFLFDFASNVLWNKMFRRGFLVENGLCFQSVRQANDIAFVMMALYLAETITCVDKKLVFYRVNNSASLTGRSSETIFCPYEAYLYTMQELKKYPEFCLVQRSFRNKTARGMFRALNIQTSFEAYEKLYNFLKEEGLKQLEIDKCRKEDLEETWIYDDLERMKKVSAGDFLVYKTNERRWDRDQLKYTLRRVRRRLAPLFFVNQRLKRIRKKN